MADMEPQATVPLVDASAPLKGVVLCCTNIEPDTRTALAKHAEEMGAAHRYDLTSEVTHLITGHYETPKYRYVAKERPDVKILNLEWIEAVRQLWINDQPINLEQLEKKHKRATFETLRICMTGFEDPLRSQIIDTVKENGGEYSGDLTKTITHLIAKTPEGTKYKFAKQWGLQLVTQEWLFDSVERGMILEEKLYRPDMPAEDRGKGAWVRHKAITPAKRDREDSAAGGGARKIRRTLSTKLQSQNEVIWGDIMGSGGDAPAPMSLARQTSIADTNATSTLSTLRTLSNISGMDGAVERDDLERKAQGTFSNCRFYIHGFGTKRAEIMRQHLVSHDAQVGATQGLLELPHDGKSFMLVPHNLPKSRLPPVPATVPVVTDWFIERCLEAKACLEPLASKFDLPFLNQKIEGLEGMAISSTGFSGYHLLHLSKVLKLMGAEYAEFFTKNSSVLVCNMQRQMRVEKIDRAREWQVPIVDVKWLLDSIQSGKKELYKPYLLRQKKENGAPRDPLTKKSSMASLSFVRKTFDGFDTSMDQTPNEMQEVTVRSVRRMSKPAERDTTAFEKEADQDGGLETLNDLLKKYKKPPGESAKAAEKQSTAVAEESHMEDDVPTAVPMAVPEGAPQEAAESESIPLPDEDMPLPPQSPSKPRTSPQKPISPQKLPQKRPIPLLDTLDTQETMETITSLLTKPKSKPFTASDPNQNPRRILGRAPSNVNHIHRESSVLSGGISGDKAERNSFSRNSSLADQVGKKGGLERTASMGSVVEQLLAQEGEGDTQQKEPTQTQRVSYFDEDAEAEKEQALARMMGRQVEKKPKERSTTIASLGGGRGLRTTKRVKEADDEMGSKATGR